ncbi:ABC transporter substrate-binding protein [Pimelobacter sp. 30-1]|uniref:ABC transporter substrate-binding protein n=1 Tax=Pimelobacter sp. 30-1 TaxID=2004991 RepID=UPI001C04A6C8|nr:ABC transporter substrate-binding protein [Pimelobacter sp. 30-1]
MVRTPRYLGRLGVALTLAAALALSACGSEDDDPGTSGADTRTVASAYGDVEVPVKPERVVAVSYDTPWQLQSLDVKPVATQDYGKWVDTFSADQQAFVKGVATIGSFGETNYDAIVKAAPDLIVGDAYEVDEKAYKRLSEIAPTVVVKGGFRGDWKAIVSGLADATGAGKALGEREKAYTAKVAELKEKYADQLALTWATVSIGDAEAEFSVLYPTGIIGALLDELGVTPAPGIPEASPEPGYASYSFERLDEILATADVIVTPANADGTPWEPFAAIKSNSLFTSLPAAKSGSVFDLPYGVTDYDTALAFLDVVETKVLEPLAARS